MSFQYQPMDNDSIEDIGNIQSAPEDGDQILCPARPLLPRWPYCLGLFQIAVGFLTLGFGAVEVFIVPFLISVDGQWSLSVYNSYGAGLWAGIMLILSGSLAVRASKTKALISIQWFYWTTLWTFTFNTHQMALMLWCAYFKVFTPSLIQDSDSLENYTWVSMVTTVWCIMGCFLLLMTVCNYFMVCMFGEVKLLLSLGICCCPCIFYKNPPSHGSSIQSMSGSESNMIV